MKAGIPDIQVNGPGLKVTIEANIKATDFLDLMLDLETNTYNPFRKETKGPMYINAKSNHPPKK